MGCWVVAEDLCTGSRYYWDLVDDALEPMEALARRYIQRIPCARMKPYTGRFNHLVHLAEAFKADGIIYKKIKFCVTVQPLSKMNVIPTEGRNLYLPPVWERFLAALEMTKNLNC